MAETTAELKKRLKYEYPDTDPFWNVIKQLEDQSKVMIPTPRIGDIVMWANVVRADNVYRPAIVTRVLDPGRIECHVFGDASIPIQSSTLYIPHPKMLNMPGIRPSAGGWWFYRDALDNPAFTPPQAAYKAHMESLDKRKDLAIADADARKKRALEIMEMRTKFEREQAAARGAQSAPVAAGK